jgi:hypothetical protein
VRKTDTGRWPVIATAKRGDLGAALDAVINWRDLSDIYINCNAIRVDDFAALPAGSRGGAADIDAVLCVWADLDVAGPNHNAAKRYPPTISDAMAILEELPTYSMLLHTGGGLGAFWYLDEPIIGIKAKGTGKEIATHVTQRWVRTVANSAALLGREIDEGVGDLPRIMRLAGTYNHKPAKRGAPLQECVLEICNGWPMRRYTLEELQASMVPLEANPAAVATQRKAGPSEALQRPHKATRSSTEYNLLELVDVLPWHDIWPAGWEYVRQEQVNNESAEIWVRPGAASTKSATCWDRGCQVFSDAIPGLPAGGYSKAEIQAWAIGLDPHDVSGLAKTIFADSKAGAR